ncbi:coatomer subunit beta-like [Lingula anatina]|uniref:Coatomer subunit beta-like n=1 Tax=Lingula anatina TaxID=7574 RepID=A0A1S3I1N7_LINAN|nr:coatomer subunit beta-like [Lingula anatina]|eukprot:XP_013392180.1 coatomer subunit beta-like [Lingula anatina]
MGYDMTPDRTESFTFCSQRSITEQPHIFSSKSNFDFLIPDAPELIANFLEGEQDASCKRNAFMMLIHVDQERALSYLVNCDIIWRHSPVGFSGTYLQGTCNGHLKSAVSS